MCIGGGDDAAYVALDSGQIDCCGTDVARIVNAIATADEAYGFLVMGLEGLQGINNAKVSCLASCDKECTGLD